MAEGTPAGDNLEGHEILAEAGSCVAEGTLAVGNLVAEGSPAVGSLVAEGTLAVDNLEGYESLAEAEVHPAVGSLVAGDSLAWAEGSRLMVGDKGNPGADENLVVVGDSPASPEKKQFCFAESLLQRTKWASAK